MQPTPEQIVDFALVTLRELAPQIAVTRDGLALQIQRDKDRALVWNLHDFARLAPANPAWRDELRDLSRQVVERLTTAFEDKQPTGGIGLRLRPDARVPAELRTGEYAAEPVLDGLWAMYGEQTSDGIAIRPWSMLLGEKLAREDLRTLAAAMTLGGDFSYGDMMCQMEDLPIFTNEEFHPHIAAALMMPAAWWTQLMDGIRPRPETLLAMIPSPSRIFITPVDVPDMVEALRGLIPSYQETEEELLSMHVYRFDGTSWRAVIS